MVKSGEMLIGQYCSRVSPKGRVAFPKKFRDQMGDRLVVTRGYEKNGKWIIPSVGTGTGGRPKAISFY